MSQTADRAQLIGSVPLGDCEEVFRPVGGEIGPYPRRLPDGETTRLRFKPGVDLDSVAFGYDRASIRIAAARRVVADFGIAGECGCGRADPDRLPGLLASCRLAADCLT